MSPALLLQSNLSITVGRVKIGCIVPSHDVSWQISESVC